MSCLRVRRASLRGRAFPALVLALAVLAAACGSGDDASQPVPPGIDLPEVGTLGRQPKGPGTIVVDVTAHGHITIGEKGPLSLVGLRDELQRLTADVAWREPDHTSLKILLLRADRSLPWRVSQWVLQVACEPTVGIHRIFFGAWARDGGGVGAIGCALPKDRGGPVDWFDPPPQLTVRVVPRDGVPSEPEDMLPALRAAAGEDPLSELKLDLAVVGGKNGEIPTGFMVRLLGVAIRAGVRHVVFEGTPPSQRFSPDDLEGLLDHVAKLRANLGSPVLKVNRQVVGALPRSEPVPSAKGRLPHLYGSRVEKTEPGPAREEAPEVFPPDPLEPVIKDEEIEDHVETDSDLPFEESLGAEGLTDAPFEGPASGHVPFLVARFGAFPSRELDGSREDAVERALHWLAAHQSPNGGWEAAGFGRWCYGKAALEADRPDGAGLAQHDVGVTGLALCAFLGAGYTNRGKHPYARTISKGLRYLKNVQDAEGCFGRRTHEGWRIDHAVATLAMVEAFGMTGSPIFKGSARKSLEFLLASPIPPYASTTAWWSLPLLSARWVNDDARHRGKSVPLPLVAEAAIEGVLAVFTEPADEWPQLASAAAVLLRIHLGESPASSEVLAARIARFEAKPPRWDVDAETVDPVAWMFGSLAAHQVGGTTWEAWSAGLHDAVRATQWTDTEVCRYLGSWNPVGTWGAARGRVGATALMVLSLEAPYRYARVFEGPDPSHERVRPTR